MAGLRVWHLVVVLIGVCVREGWTSPVLPHDHAASHALDSPAHFFLHALFPTNSLVRDYRYTCQECKAVAAALDTMMALGASAEEIEDFVILECINFDLFPPDVCESMVRLAGEEVLFVLNNTAYNYDTVCGWLLGAECHNTELDPWTMAIPGGKPEPSHPEPEQPPPATVKILHLSDLHLDLLYDEGSKVDCVQPYCCRFSYGIPEPGERLAGHWGAMADCDLPLRTLDELVAQAALTNVDMVYVTGDLPPHDVWMQTHDTNLLSINETMNVLKKYFPDIPVVNALGNHASAPVNSFVVPAAYDDGWSMSWLYDGVAEMWAQWLPSETVPDIQRGGFFSYSPMAGLRVVSINMNYCNTLNWWLLMENDDPTGELQWLVDTLAAAEAAGELVHILGHIPMGGGDCDHIWSHIINQIIVRYESTIRAMFFGHTHGDNWEVVYDPAQNYTRPVAVSFISPSGTPATHRHPAFKVFTVDGGHAAATWSVIDAEVHNMNLTQANTEGGTPDFKFRYSSRDSYGITSMTPASIHQLMLDMVHNVSIYETYEWNTNNDWVEVPDNWSCDKNCLKSSLCGKVSSDSSNREACHNLEDYIDSVYPDSL